MIRAFPGAGPFPEPARLLQGRVLELIGVDTLENVEYPLTSGELKGMTAALHKDFAAGSRQFVAEMFSAGTNRRIREWVLSDMSSAPAGGCPERDGTADVPVRHGGCGENL